MKVRVRDMKDCFWVELNSRALVWFVRDIFGIPIGYKTNKVRVPNILCLSSKSIVCSFLRGLFDADGSAEKTRCLSLFTLSEIDVSLYNSFQNIAQKLHLSEGEVLSLMMKEFNLKFQDEHFPDLSSTTLLKANRNIPVITVAHHDNLRITECNLQNISTKISFKQIKVLEFADVNPKTFMQKIEIIQNCNLVKVPASFPRLLF